MEFGFMGIDGLEQQVLEGKPKYNNNGSNPIKQERSDPFENEDKQASKLAKQAHDFGIRSDNKHQMLSFSSTDQNVPFFHQETPFSRTSMGFGSGNVNVGMHGSFTGIRGPFTPAQWIELEHQAMIYKYFTANVPVPSNLLIPIRKAIQCAGFPGFSIESYPSHTYGWGSFHLGFSGNTDPEPGRCRRTDGKKWRCSRDAVPDQKYCERHINRGRHRSRKPVEGQTGQAASGAATTKVVQPPLSASMSLLVTPGGGGVPNSVAIAPHHIKGLHPFGATNDSSDPITKRLNDQQSLSVRSSTTNLESKDPQYSIPKHHISFDESSVSDFGVVSNDSFLNPTQKSSYVDCKSYSSLLDFNIHQNQDQSPLRPFMDNWPKDQAHRSAIPWPKDPKSDWTQLSMSMPTSTDFSSSSSSPNREKSTVSPLRVSHELNPTQVCFGVGTIVPEVLTTQNGWTPISWGKSNLKSMGGPLGEALLNNASNTLDKGERWDGSSPTGVLQKSTFVSVSNSSSVGSPNGGQSNAVEGASTCDDLHDLGGRPCSASIPSL